MNVSFVYRQPCGQLTGTVLEQQKSSSGEAVCMCNVPCRFSWPIYLVQLWIGSRQVNVRKVYHCDLILLYAVDRQTDGHHILFDKNSLFWSLYYWCNQIKLWISNLWKCLCIHHMFYITRKEMQILFCSVEMDLICGVAVSKYLCCQSHYTETVFNEIPL